MTTKAQLRQIILDETHKNYVSADIDRYIAQAEQLIATRLETYPLEYTLTDADRVTVGGAVYNLPAKTRNVRYIHTADYPLDQVDENLIASTATSTNVVCFAVRPKTVILAGTPATGATFLLQYFGLPAALAVDADTNALLNDCQALYIEAASMYVFNRAQDYESAGNAFERFKTLCDEINRWTKKLIGGARATNPYNTQHRSSY
jgi:hypothetical protein